MLNYLGIKTSSITRMSVYYHKRILSIFSQQIIPNRRSIKFNYKHPVLYNESFSWLTYVRPADVTDSLYTDEKKFTLSEYIRINCDIG